MRRLSRREFMTSLARAGIGAAAIASLPPWLPRALAGATPAGPGLIERNAYPEHWETTLEALDRSWLTPADRFFVRSHFGAPAVDDASWRMELAGSVATPGTISLHELRAMPSASITCVIECAGNGRGRFPLASTSGTQWEYGAVGNATWTGVRLSELLRRARPASDAGHVWFEGADAAPLESVPRFVRSIPVEKAMGDVILAHTMNGAPLTPLHGGPLRAIVPGWFGMASTKWLRRIRVETAPSDNRFMVRGYRYVAPGGDPTTSPPVAELRVKSLITHPLDGAHVRAGSTVVRGFAWAGAAGVRRVEISADGGTTWTDGGYLVERFGPRAR